MLSGFLALFFGAGIGCSLVEHEPLDSGEPECLPGRAEQADMDQIEWGVSRGFYREEVNMLLDCWFDPDSEFARKEEVRKHKAKAERERRHAMMLACELESRRDAFAIVLPENPNSWDDIRFIAVSRRPIENTKLQVLDGEGEPVEIGSRRRWGLGPMAWSAKLKKAEPGPYTAVLSAPDGSIAACVRVMVRPGKERERRLPETGAWEVRRSWDPHMEDLFSVFIARLFYVQPGENDGWRPLHEVLREPSRNMFHDMFGWDEDSRTWYGGVQLIGDCGDAPYLLRAYFAWKMGLPFIFNRCTRGEKETGPKCNARLDNLTDDYDYVKDPVERFNKFAWYRVNMGVHSGNGRTFPDETRSDFYPIELRRENLRPGIVFVDSAGHYIVVTQLQRQTKSTMGALFGVDAHPDHTVTPKQFAPGSFVFNPEVITDGFKAFRPAVYEDGEIRFLTNEELRAQHGFMVPSDEQAKITSSEAFYQRVGKLLNPEPVDPVDVLEEKIQVLKQLTRERVQAIRVGEQFMRKRNWADIGMPEGKSIFQTSGAWEAYSTPARDMRYLIAVDDVLTLPNRILENPELYALPANFDRDRLEERFETRLDEMLQSEAFEYRRSDGSKWGLRLSDVVARLKALEMGYNPNDCPEVRWGAPDGSEERETCARRAPRSQTIRMSYLRHWFAQRYRPTAD